MVQRVLILGAGSHGRLLSEHVESEPQLEVVGFTNPDTDQQEARVHGHEVLGTDSDIPLLFERDVMDAAVVGVGDSNLEVRERLGERLREWTVPLLTFVHDSSEVAPSARLNDGTVIFPQAYVGTDADVGGNVVVYSSVTVEHDTTIADDAYLAPGAVLCGNVSIGQRTLIGANATILPGRTVEEQAVVGAGAVVTRDVESGERVAGVPAESID